ncbi:hypothetical protein CDEF62S_00739 [Castellaniella defragrans]
MKVTTTLTALAIGLASMGLAQAAETAPAATNVQATVVSSAGHDPYYPNLVQQDSASRAQVVQQLQQAEADGQVTNGHDPYYPMAVAARSESRAQVVQELQQAQADGELASVGHDAYYPTRPAV